MDPVEQVVESKNKLALESSKLKLQVISMRKIIKWVFCILTVLSSCLYCPEDVNAAEILQPLVDHLKNHYQNQSIIADDYQNGEKWTAFLSGPVFPAIGATVAIDLADYAGVTAEGQQGWVTLWADPNVGASIGIPISFGMRKMPFGNNAPDSRTSLFDCHAGENVTGMNITALSVTSNGLSKIMSPTIGPQISLSAGGVCEIHGMSIEIRRDFLNAILEGNLISGIGVASFTKAVMSQLLQNDEQLYYPWDFISNVRLATMVDDDLSTKIQSITAQNLTVGQTGPVTVRLKPLEDGKYYVKVWDDDGLTPPEWEWGLRSSNSYSMLAGEVKDLVFTVIPADDVERFEFWVYQEDFDVFGVSFYKIIEKIDHRLVASLADLENPAVLSHYHASGVDTNIFVKFTENIAVGSLTNANITVSGSSSGNHASTFNFNNSTNELVINPNVNFNYGESVTVTVGSGVGDLAGNPIVTPYIFSFVVTSSPVQVPTSISVSAMASPSTTTAFSQVSVSGTATYNTGALVQLGTASITSGGNTWTAPLNNGSFSVSVDAPNTSQNVSISVSDGTLTGSGNAYITINENPTSSNKYTLTTDIVESARDNGSSASWIWKDSFRTTDSVVYALSSLTNGSWGRWIGMRWKFYKPDGSLYGSVLEVPDSCAPSMSWCYRYWGYNIKDNLMATLPGRYSVKYYLNENYGAGWEKKATHSYVVGWDFTEHRMAKDVGGSPSYQPITPTNTFYNTDTKALTWANFDMVAQPIDIKWEFYEPNGNLYSNTSQITPDPGVDKWWNWYRTWGWLNISGTMVASKPGDWLVKVLVKHPVSGIYEQYYTDNFRILENPAVMPGVSVSSSPLSPSEMQPVTLSVTATDNTMLKKVVLNWNDGTNHAVTLKDGIFSKNYTGSYVVGSSFVAGQRINYWVEAWDTSGNRTESMLKTITIQPELVTTPNKPSGQIYIKPNELSTYSSGGASTNLGSLVEYQFDWGDGSVSGWGGLSQTHSWINDGTFFIKVSARSKTNLGRVSSSSSALSVVVDSLPPTGPGNTIKIDNGINYTNSTSVLIDLLASDDNGIKEMQFSNDNINWSVAEPYVTHKPWVLPSVDGSKTVYVRFKDFSGNLSSIFSDTIILDTAPPSDGNLLIVDTSSMSMTFNWSGFFDNGSGVQDFTFVYSTTGLPTSCADGQVIYSGSGTSITHGGLQLGTVYYYRLCATDYAGHTSAGVTTSMRYQGNDIPTCNALGASVAEAPLQTARDQFAGAAIGGKIFAFGGNGAPNAVNLNSLEIFDPTSGQWLYGASNIHNGGFGVEEVTGATLNGKFYVFGAYGGYTGGVYGVFNFVEEYDPATDTWTSKAPMPTVRAGAPALAFNGEIYLFAGGYCTGAGCIKYDVVEAYNPVTNTWRTVTNIPTPVGGPAVALIGNKAYLIGGYLHDGSNPTALTADIQVYDFATNSWSTTGRPPLPNPRVFSYSTAAPVVDGKIYLIGGYDASALGISDKVDIYDPVSNSWCTGASLVKPVGSELASVNGSSLYVAGGVVGYDAQTGNDIRTNEVWRYPLSPLKDDLTVDFGPGVGFRALYNNATKPSGAYDWTRINDNRPLSTAIGDLDGSGIDDLIADFGPGVGLRVLYDSSTKPNGSFDWKRLSGGSPLSMTVADLNGNGIDDLIVDFGAPVGFRVLYDNSTRPNGSYKWTRISNSTPVSLAVADLDGNSADDLVVDFGSPVGLRVLYNNGKKPNGAYRWTRISNGTPLSMNRADLNGNSQDELIIDFGAPVGLRVLYDNSTRANGSYIWTRISGGSPLSLAVADLNGSGQDDLIIDFGGSVGLRVLYDNSIRPNGSYIWTRLSGGSPDAMVIADLDGTGAEDLVIDFGPGTGMRVLYNNSTRPNGSYIWTRITSGSPTPGSAMTVADLDGTGKDDLVVDFGGGIGLRVLYNNDIKPNGAYRWTRISGGSPVSMAVGSLDSN